MTVLQLSVWVFIGVIAGSIATWIVMRQDRQDRRRREVGPFGGRHDDEVFDRQKPEAASEADPPPEDDEDEDEDEEDGEDIREMLLSGGRFQPGTVIDQDVDLTDFEHDGDVILDGVEIEGQLLIEGLDLSGKLSLNEASISDGIDFDEGARVGYFSLERAKIGGRCYVPSSQGGASLVGATCEEDVILSNEEFGSIVDCRGIRTGGNFTADTTIFASILILTGADIGAQLDLQDAEMAALDIEYAHIGDICNLERTSVRGEFLYQGAHIEGSLFLKGSDIELFPGLQVDSEIHV